jgi:hypothetical protein
MVKLETGMVERSFKPGSRCGHEGWRNRGSFAQWTLPLFDEGEEEIPENTEQGKAETPLLEFPEGVNVSLFKKIFLGDGISEAEKEAESPVSQEMCWCKNCSNFRRVSK